MFLSAPKPAAQAASSAGPCVSPPLLITGVGVWTPAGVLANRDVLFRDGRIASIETADSAGREGMYTIDGAGHTLLPGLIDAHLHLSAPGGLPPTTPPRTDGFRIIGRQLLASGVTAGRMHQAPIERAALVTAASEEPCAAMPRLRAGGPDVSGHATADAPHVFAATSPADATEKIERIRRAGLDWVEIYETHKFPSGVLDAIATAARRIGLRIQAGVGSAEDLSSVMRISPDSLDGLGLPEPEYSPASLALLRASARTTLVPMFGLTARTAAYANEPALAERAENFALLADSDRTFLLINARAALADAAAMDAAVRNRASLARKFQQLKSTGRPMAMGTDCGSSLHFQPTSIWWELETWRTLGATPREALVAATETGARLLGMTDAGRLVTGARGDAVLYRGNPERVPFEASRVQAVIKDGVIFVSDGRWQR